VEDFKFYRKKPVTIRAWKFDPDPDENDWIEDFLDRDSNHEYDDEENQIVIHTLEGNMRASVGDYVIQGVQGEFYPCKSDIFHETYEEVDG